MTQKCFICGIEKTKFDEAFQKRGIQKGFEQQHTDHEHNMWDYVALSAYLELKEETSFTGLETYVNNAASRGALSYFPIGRASSVQSPAHHKHRHH